MKSGRLFSRFYLSIEKDIKSIIHEYGIVIDSYFINEDGSIDVDGNVRFRKNSDSLLELPLKFNKISGDFDCSRLGLVTLNGSPIEVGGTFDCSYNQLTSLEFAPKKAYRLVFDDTIKSLYTDGLNCNFKEVELLYRAIIPKIGLPNLITKNAIHVATIIAYQSYYNIWNGDESLNVANFEGLLEDIKDGL
jgi:hypothetical protein